MQGTRVELLDRTVALIKTSGGARIVWIAGMAGTGKTSIALTLCRMLTRESNIILGGTFFCSRTAGAIERTDVQCIVPTLATVLARKIPLYAEALAAQLKDDHDLAYKLVRIQVEHLLVRPLAKLSSLGRHIIFVVDGLDECTDQQQVADFVNAISDLDNSMPVKFLFTSRPEMYIRETPITDGSLSSIVHLHTVDPLQVKKDIRLYIQKTFENAPASSIWYQEGDIDDLVTLSGGLFISASTAVAYILRRRDTPGRVERLRTVRLQTSTSGISTAPLDKMYSLVLTQALDPDTFEPTELDEMRRILAAILAARAPLTVKALAELLWMSPERLRGALNELHAVVFVPEDDDEGELHTLHASFSDFIFTRAPDQLRIQKSLAHDELARACLQRMAADDLCFNVSRSGTSYRANPKFKPGWIADSLTYACLHWAHHVDLAPVRSAYGHRIGSILRLKLLFWLEVLSVIGEVGQASGLLRIAASVVSLYTRAEP